MNDAISDRETPGGGVKGQGDSDRNVNVEKDGGDSVSPSNIVADDLSIVTDSERARSVLSAVEKANKGQLHEPSGGDLQTPTDGDPKPPTDGDLQPPVDGAFTARDLPIVNTANSLTFERDIRTPSKATLNAEYTPRRAELGRIPSPTVAEKQERERKHKNRISAKTKLPNGMVRLSTVTMSNRGRVAIGKHCSNFIDHAGGSDKKVISLEEAYNSRPPLQPDMDGPTPCTYTLPNKPFRQNNAPHWSFGRKTFIEKDGGSRTSWEKTWFQTPHVYQQKTDFNSDKWWPSPAHYQPRHHSIQLGHRQHTLPDAPSFSIGIRRLSDLGQRKGTENEPAPGNYEKETAKSVTLPRAPAFTHGQRRGGTVIWSSGELTPGPGSYNPAYVPTQTHRPAYTIQGIRRSKSHYFGPFSTF